MQTPAHNRSGSLSSPAEESCPCRHTLFPDSVTSQLPQVGSASLSHLPKTFPSRHPYDGDQVSTGILQGTQRLLCTSEKARLCLQDSLQREARTWHGREVFQKQRSILTGLCKHSVMWRLGTGGSSRLLLAPPCLASPPQRP